MDDLEIMQRLGLALAIGLLIGVERGYHTREESDGLRIAGVRTFALIGLSGGVAAILSLHFGNAAFLVALGGMLALGIAAHALSVGKRGDYGITTEVAEVIVFALGALAVRGDMTVTAALAVVTVAVLDLKRMMHKSLNKLSRPEIVAVIKLLLISVVLLPLLPDESYGPSGLFNPFQIWMLVVMISTISFVGYVAIRLMGARAGTLATAFFGGIASSTATTLNFSRLAKRAEGHRALLAAGIGISGSIMLPRLLIVIGAVNAALVPALLVPLGLMLATGLAVSALFVARSWGETVDGGDLELDNPLELGTALKFGVLIVAVLVLSFLARKLFGDAGIYALAGASGLADTEAIGLALARMAKIDVDPTLAARGVVIAAIANTLVKVGIAAAVARDRALVWRVAIIVAAISAAGVAGMYLI